MKITLIQPAMGRRGGDFIESWKMEPLSIVALANQTPSKHELSFWDDRLEPIPFDRPADLVGISTETYTARRTYQIAREYRKRGAKVVIGGYHATLVPEETREHCDAIVIGEAEPVWPQLLADAEQGKLQPIYKAEKRPPLSGLRRDRSILQGKVGYSQLALVESGRGCKFGCNFCSISAFFNQTYDYRPAAEVAAEIAATGRKLVFLVDDNVVANFDRAKELFRAIAPLKIKWIGQGTLISAKDRELLREMRNSGCEGLLIGFESLSEGTLRSMNKNFNVLPEGLGEAIGRIRDEGIKIYATFVFGYDTDTPDVFERTLEFAVEQKFFVTAFNHLQPFPGTPLYQKMAEEGRMLHERWWVQPGVRFGDVIFRPKNMAPEELLERLMQTRRRYFSVGSIARRALDFKANLSSPTAAFFYFWGNAILRKELDEKFGLPLGDLSMPDPLER